MFLAWGLLTVGIGHAQDYHPKADPLVNPEAMLQPPPEDRSAIATGDWLIFCLPGNPRTLCPIFASSRVDARVVTPLFEGLFTFDAQFNWMPNPDVVAEFGESEDHLIWTVTLKPGLKWHDGHPFTAHDVAYSWEQILDDRVPCPAQKPGTDQIEQCLALDDLTVKFVHKQALPTAKWNALFPVIPKHLYEKHKSDHPDLRTGEYYNHLARAPVGNGPYRFVEWKENDKIVFERWEDYPGTKPYFKRYIFRIIPDRRMAKLAFEKGEIDECGLTPQQFALECDSQAFRRVGRKAWCPQWQYSYIGWNMDGSNPFFGDKRVRHAMTHALDLPMCIEKIGYNLTQPCRGPFHPDSRMFNPQIKPLSFSLDRAGALLDEAGWAIDAETGWRTRQINGETVTFEFSLMVPQPSKNAQRIAAIFQQDLKRIGVSLKIQILEWATFQQRLRQHQFQAYLSALGTGLDPDMYWNLWRTEEYEKGRNYNAYSNPEVDRLLEVARHEFDADKRIKLYQQIHQLVYEDQPYTFLTHSPCLWAMHKRIRGVSFSPRGVFGVYPGPANWWVPAGEQKYGQSS